VGLDDPVVIAMIVAVAVFLFGSNKIPQFARALGQARREFDQGLKGLTAPLEQPLQQPQRVSPPATTAQVSAPSTQPAATESSDLLVEAAKKEGIDTTGKTRQQIASELAWKLRNTNPT
jgi:sec-independent protein translocase protein TatA